MYKRFNVYLEEEFDEEKRIDMLTVELFIILWKTNIFRKK